MILKIKEKRRSCKLNIFRENSIEMVNEHLIKYPTPVNLSYFWGFGSLAGICLVIQIISGIFLAMHYAPDTSVAFDSIEHILRDVPNGWLLKYTHANGASIFFIVVYTHIARGLYYGSYLYPRHYLWISGVVIFILMMATAFMGYVLPWGQMSFWGATVITNLFSAIPLIGNDISYFLWGGFSVDNPTLNRFFSLHYLLPFLIVGVVFLHLLLLHNVGSSNPLSLEFHNDKVPFYPYFYVKDLLGVIYLMLLFCFLVCFYPNTLGHPDNYIPADPLVTPSHIVPEWYFLPFYAILRSIPNKLGGVLCMGASIAVLFILPILSSKYMVKYRVSLRDVSYTNSMFFFHELVFWFFIINTFFLGWIGACPVEDPYLKIGQILTFLYFFFFFMWTYGLPKIYYMILKFTFRENLYKRPVTVGDIEQCYKNSLPNEESRNPFKDDEQKHTLFKNNFRKNIKKNIDALETLRKLWDVYL